ncbi:Nn.00g035810.m01.CDS01 [Neocucurbitaria sp. VM-36]
MSTPIQHKPFQIENSAGESSATRALIRPVTLPPTIKHALRSAPSAPLARELLGDMGESAFLARRALSSEQCETFVRGSDHWPWMPMSAEGKTSSDDLVSRSANASTCADYYRVTARDEDVAQALWTYTQPLLRPLYYLNEDPSEPSKSSVWRPIGMDPLLQFERSKVGGNFPPRYISDSNHTGGDRKNLMTVLIFLTQKSKDSGGNIRFLLDKQRWMPSDERSFDQLTVAASQKDVLIEVEDEIGDFLFFDHRVLHDESIWRGDSDTRIILRTAVIYEHCEQAPIHTNLYPPPADERTSADLDPTYQKALVAFGNSYDRLAGAGYFDDGLPGGYRTDPRWWTGPVDKVQKRLSLVKDSSKELVVLLTTGGFCPIHKGHLQMMESAKIDLEVRGMAVLGGYFCPDHDQYVNSKLRSKAITGAQRLHLCELAVASSDWLMVDAWAALYAPSKVNLTRILDHISQMLSHNIRTHRPIRVIYACGGDNAMLCASFVSRGSCISVLRPGSQAMFDKVSQDDLLRENPRVMFCWDTTMNIASTGIRRGDLSGVPDAARSEWMRIRRSSPRPSVKISNPLNFYVRDEGSWVVSQWADIPGFDVAAAERLYHSFLEGLLEALAAAFLHDSPSDHAVRIITLSLQAQERIYREKFADKAVISLDACLPGTENLEISRIFKPLSKQGYVFGPRPGTSSIETQIESIPPGEYTLFDDDCFSGNTGDFAMSRLSGHCTILNFETLCDANGPLDAEGKSTQLGKRLDHADCRDFLAGSREGGFVLQLVDNSICRAPHVLPYVSPHDRASVPVTAEFGFSKTVWKLNKAFYSSLGIVLCIRDMSPAFQELCDSLGFPPETTMTDFCTWHMEHFPDPGI